MLVSTVIVVTGNHGEGLAITASTPHGTLAYDSTLKVPLVVSGAAVPTRLVTAPVSLADLAPTLSRVADLTTTGPSADLLAPTLAERDVYAETLYPARGWVACVVGSSRGSAGS